MMLAGDPAIFGRSRAVAPSGPTHTPSHPLLVDAPSSDSQQNAPSRRQQRGASQQESAAYNEWVQNIEQMVGAGAVEALQDLLGRNGLGHLSGPDQISLQIAPGPEGGLALMINPSGGAAAGAPGGIGRHQHRLSTTPRSGRREPDRFATDALVPVMTVPRWVEEARDATGILPAERIARLSNHVINILHPVARRAAHLAEEADAERHAQEEKEEKEEREAAEAKELEIEKRKEEARLAEPEAPSTEPSTSAAMDLETPSEPTVALPTPSDPTPAPAATPAPAPPPPAEDVAMADDVAEVLSLARSLAAGLGAALPAPPAPDAMETDEGDEEDEDHDEEHYDEGFADDHIEEDSEDDGTPFRHLPLSIQLTSLPFYRARP